MLDTKDREPRRQAVLDFMNLRRSAPVAAMAAPGPDDDELLAMVAIAARVPDHGKLAPWRFIRYGPQACRRLGDLCEARAAETRGELTEEQRKVERTRFTRAPVVVAVVSRAAPHPKIPEWEQVLSAGAAAMNLVIAANASGFDVQWITEWPAYDEALAPALGLREGEKIAGFVHIGTRTLPKTERDRPSTADVFSVMEG